MCLAAGRCRTVLGTKAQQAIAGIPPFSPPPPTHTHTHLQAIPGRSRSRHGSSRAALGCPLSSSHARSRAAPDTRAWGSATQGASPAHTRSAKPCVAQTTGGRARGASSSSPASRSASRRLSRACVLSSQPEPGRARRAKICRHSASWEGARQPAAGPAAAAACPSPASWRSWGCRGHAPRAPACEPLSPPWVLPSPPGVLPSLAAGHACTPLVSSSSSSAGTYEYVWRASELP